MKIEFMRYKSIDDENVNHTFIPSMAVDSELKLRDTLSRWNMSYKEYWRTG